MIEPKVIEPKVIQPKDDAPLPRGKIAVWVPNGIETDKDTTILSKPWVKVDAMVNTDIILCTADLKTASLKTKLCAKLFRQRMVDLEWMSASGQRGQSIDHPPLAYMARKTVVDIDVTPCAKEKHHGAISLLESFNATLVRVGKKGPWFVYSLKFHYDLDAFFGSVKKPTMSASTLAFTFIICTAADVHELRELASFKFGHRKDSSVIARSVTSFHAFAACL